MNIETSRTIQKRDKPNDVFYTPDNVVDIHLKLIKPFTKDYDTYLDPFYGKGAYYDKLPVPKYYTEIELGKDFFKFIQNVDIIVSNPPYSIIDKVLEHSISLNPRVISFLIGMGNLTTKRIELLNNAGYGLAVMHMMKIWKWYGMSFIVVFVKGEENCISYDRTVYR